MLSDSKDFINSSQKKVFEKNTEAFAKNFEVNKEKISKISMDEGLKVSNYIDKYANRNLMDKKILPEMEYYKSKCTADNQEVKEAKTYLEEKHTHTLGKAVIGVETVDHPTEGQLLEKARDFFRQYDLFH